MDKKILLTIAAAVSVATAADAQTSSDWMNPTKKADNSVVFDVKSSGKALPVDWGMDTAWDDEYNVKWGIAHFGENFTTGRISFQPYEKVGQDLGDGNFGLPSNMAKKLKQRIDRIKWTGTKKVAINCDHEVLTRALDKDGNYGEKEDNVGVGNYRSTLTSQNTAAWVSLIKASVKYAQAQGLEVVSVSPFNEPDYGWNQFYNGNPGTKDTRYGKRDFLSIVKALRADAFFSTGAGKNVRICGPNTLNCDEALPWYEYSNLANYLDEGNTHQLAGSFGGYAGFFERMRQDGKVATADELHNVGEAIVGAEYGMQNGIWWAFDGKARGQFMIDSNEGVRVGYGEDRGRWTSAAVYRNDKEGSVHGFIGTSERQANTTNYQFVSKGQDVFFNGMGPTRQWAFEIPGGTGYQKGQVNAELVFDITYGADVAPFHPNGDYQIMSAADKRLITSKGTHNDVTCEAQANSNAQRWHIYPDNSLRGGGDCSYWFIDNYEDADQHLNLRDGKLEAGTKVLTYNANHDALEQWYLRYAKDGYYYIMARRSKEYLFNNNGSISVEYAPTSSASEEQLNKYLWRLMPIDAVAETTAPAAPTGLKSKPNPASVTLSWNPVSEANVTYTILRSDAGEWNTIGRNVTGETFTDNTALPGKFYTYKVMAVDYSGNRSAASASIGGAQTGKNALIMHLDFENVLTDASDSKLDPQFYNASYQETDAKVGSNSLTFGNGYGMLPYSVAANDKMTIAMWVRLRTIDTWQRLFDFGNDEQHYMFFTPMAGDGNMRFVMCNGNGEEVLSGNSAIPTQEWTHVAVSIGESESALYINGNLVGTKEFTIKPSDIDASLCYIARSMFNADGLLDGNIDDVRIYNFALDADNVRRVYANETVIIPADEQTGDKDMTGLIINPTVTQTGDTNTLPEGWKVNEHVTGNGHYTEGTGDTRLEAWHWTADLNADYYQDISVPNGLYTLAAVTHQDANGNSALYAGTYRNYEQQMPVGAGSDALTEVDEILVTDGQLRIGIKTSGKANWMTADNFTLTYHGVPSDLTYYTSAIAYLDELAEVEMARNVDHTALEAARGVAHSCEANADSYASAINDYLAAIKASQLMEEVVPPVVEPGDYFAVNVATGLYLNGANTYGTKASVTSYAQLLTLNARNDGTYTIDTHISNGADSHYLGGGANTYVDSPAAIHTIEKVGEGVFAIMNGGKYLAADASGIVNFNAAEATAAAQWKLMTKAELLNAASSATEDSPADMTFLISDANFSRNNTYFDEWQGDKPGKGGRDVNLNAEKWGGNSQEFDSYQTLTGLPDGVYKLSAQGFYRYNNTTENTNNVASAAHADGTEKINSYLYANTAMTPLMSIADEASVAANGGVMPFDQNQVTDAFNKGLYNNELTVEVKGGTLQIGVKKTEHPGTDWTVWDNFRLTYLGKVIPVKDGDYFIVNVATGLYLNGANTYGTKASVTSYGQSHTLAMKEDGTYTIDTHISNGADSHYLGGGDNTYVDSPAADHTVEKVGEGVFTIMNGGKYLAADAGGIVNFNAVEVTAAAQWKLMTKAELINAASSATEDNPADMTFLISDANFSRNNTYFDEWQGDKPGKGGTDTNMNAEKWGGNSQEFDSYQTLTGLPDGVYKLSAQGFYRYNNTAENTNNVASAAHAAGTEKINSYLYANDTKVPLMSIADEASVSANGGAMPFSQGDATAAFNKGLYNNELMVEVKGGTLKIGVKKIEHPGTDWTLWDNFRLTYYGSEMTLFVANDVNHDGDVNIKDVYLLVNIILGKNADEYNSADINADGIVNIADVSALIDILNE